MSEKTGIAWTDSTHNYWRGCTKVSDGCKNCYAETLVTGRLGGEWGKGKPRIREKHFGREVLRWNKKPWVCGDCGQAFSHAVDVHYHGEKRDQPMLGSECSWHRRRVFSLSLGDWLDPEVPTYWRTDMLDIIRRTPELDHLLLTKRPELFNRLLIDSINDCERMSPAETWLRAWAYEGAPPPNVWLGVSVEDQETADDRIPTLLQIPAACRFLSVEPMLEAINLHLPEQTCHCGEGMHGYHDNHSPVAMDEPLAIDWAIFGGESGRGARPCNVQWIREGVLQCKAAGVAPFVKQLGTRTICSSRQKPTAFVRVPQADPKGGDPSEWPADLRHPALRRFPIVNARYKSLACPE